MKLQDSVIAITGGGQGLADFGSDGTGSAGDDCDSTHFVLFLSYCIK